jgi:hypothetical protein
LELTKRDVLIARRIAPCLQLALELEVVTVVHLLLVVSAKHVHHVGVNGA